ncbi:MAG: Crp/Fnr family transcriptional regulator [Microscillaceae bacterium]|jgi:CRP-like cAMP-binding protein|nr:Crp/Fnr family transcriptional regulator [Microscillaceae bacterium]
MGNQGIWYFENIDLFNLLCPHKFTEFKAKHTFHDFHKGDFVYFANEAASKIYLIADGKVKISTYTDDGKEIVKAILSKGEMFGELAFFGEEKRTDFAQVVDDNTVLCPMTVEVMQQLMRQYKDFSLQVYKLVGLRIKKLERRIESLICKDVKTRLIEFLRDEAQERGQKVGLEILIKNTYTQKDIADLIGTSRQTVTSLLNELRDQNIINFDRKRILVRDLNTLAQMLAV